MEITFCDMRKPTQRIPETRINGESSSSKCMIVWIPSSDLTPDNVGWVWQIGGRGGNEKDRQNGQNCPNFFDSE
jgi:hypothetical protein